LKREAVLALLGEAADELAKISGEGHWGGADIIRKEIVPKWTQKSVALTAVPAPTVCPLGNARSYLLIGRFAAPVPPRLRTLLRIDFSARLHGGTGTQKLGALESKARPFEPGFFFAMAPLKKKAP
jgi:hypothetical protein